MYKLYIILCVDSVCVFEHVQTVTLFMPLCVQAEVRYDLSDLQSLRQGLSLTQDPINLLVLTGKYSLRICPASSPSAEAARMSCHAWLLRGRWGLVWGSHAYAALYTLSTEPSLQRSTL